jgi:hypothetical protein
MNSKVELPEYARVQSACQLVIFRNCPATGILSEVPTASTDSWIRTEKSVARRNFNQSMEWIESQPERAQSV